MSVLVTLFSAWACLAYLPNVERERGTLGFVAWFIITGAACGAVYLMFALPVQLFVQVTPCVGLWPLLVTAMTIRSLAEPEGSTNALFGVIAIPTRWYSLVLIGFFSLLSMRPQLDLLAAWCVGVAVHQADGGSPLHRSIASVRFPLNSFLPSLSALASFEASAQLGNGQELGGGTASIAHRIRTCPVVVARTVVKKCPDSLRSRYIASGQAHGGDVSFAGKSRGGLGRGAAAEGHGPSFAPFSGSGHRLGEGASEP